MYPGCHRVENDSSQLSFDQLLALKKKFAVKVPSVTSILNYGDCLVTYLYCPVCERKCFIRVSLITSSAFLVALFHCLVNLSNTNRNELKFSSFTEFL